jgi:glycosyltransferase involved in cell wall biosynthesis
MSKQALIAILSGFPRRSETFALNEILALKRRGILGWVFATKPGEDSLIQPAARELAEQVEILPEGTPSEQAAFVLQRVSGYRISGVHGYFAHTPAEVALHVASSLKTPYGFSVHARDARKVAPEVLKLRASRAACVVACNPDVAREIGDCGTKLHLLPHGVDLGHFRPTPLPALDPLRILAVGRLVEKKGFHLLLEAADRLKSRFQIRIVGEGPERRRLESIIAERGLTDRVSLVGAKTHDELHHEYENAHLLAAPSIVDSSGDRDGLPNVVLEAMACGRAVIATDVGALTSAVIPGESGLLIRPNDADSLAAALDLFAASPDLLGSLGQGGRRLVERNYEMSHCTEQFCRALEEAYA